MHRDAMNAMANFCRRVRNILRMQPAVDRFPALSAIIGAKRTAGRDGDGYSFWIVRVEKNRAQTHPARAWRPFRIGVAAAQSAEFVAGFSSDFRSYQRVVFHA